MANIDSIFSIRIVIADFYLEKPIYGLDPCYSELKGKEIKKVPIIRIFGANREGKKTCMHVHGVFPYFYIPFKKEDFENVDRALFQIASSIDKAINISLGQGSSNAQHVFKIQLVKGIPFYGYHRKEHQYFKIYMFNPRFVKRAANLLQNGAILGKTFHPHESHLPYILQFMIDFNLYGMSFLHVPLEIIKFRRNDEDEEIPFKNLNSGQILDVSLAKKKSVSALEVDIGANFILNRFQLIQKIKSEHTNPGIEAIWNDEKVRRQKLLESLGNEGDKAKEIPALEVPATQERPDIYVSEYVAYCKESLISKLENCILSESTMLSDETIEPSQQNQTVQSFLFNSNQEKILNKKKPFHLKKLLVNAVYPDECTPEEQQLTNASFIENHLSNNNIFQNTLEEVQLSNESLKLPSSENCDTYMDDTVLDEDLILSLSQPKVPLNASLRKEDLDLLDILKDLEEDNDNENPIDLDSTLAPLSQTHKKLNIKPEGFQKDCSVVADNDYASSEDETDLEDSTAKENSLDFTMPLDDIDDFILKFTQCQTTPVMVTINKSGDSIPQVDGLDDNIPKTPVKKSRPPMSTTPPKTPTHQRIRNSSNKKASPKGSPRTPKTASKYAPIPLIITNRNKNAEETANEASASSNADVATTSRNSMDSLSKSLALSKIRRKTLAVAREIANSVGDHEAFNRPMTRSSKSKVDLDKTHITCALTPKRNNGRVLKVYSTDKKDNKNNISAESDATKAADETEQSSPKLDLLDQVALERIKFVTKLARTMAINNEGNRTQAEEKSNKLKRKEECRVVDLMELPADKYRAMFAEADKKKAQMLKEQADEAAKEETTSVRTRSRERFPNFISKTQEIIADIERRHRRKESKVEEELGNMERFYKAYPPSSFIEDKETRRRSRAKLSLKKNKKESSSKIGTDKESGEKKTLTSPDSKRSNQTVSVKFIQGNKCPEFIVSLKNPDETTTSRKSQKLPALDDPDLGNHLNSSAGRGKGRKSSTSKDPIYPRRSLRSNSKVSETQSSKLTNQVEGNSETFLSGEGDDPAKSMNLTQVVSSKETGLEELLAIYKKSKESSQLRAENEVRSSPKAQRYDPPIVAAFNVLNSFFRAKNGEASSPSKTKDKATSLEEENEEIQESDNEAEASVKLSKTPNLKRLKKVHLVENTPQNENGQQAPKEADSFGEEKLILSPEGSEEIIKEDGEPILMQSFYEESFCLNSPSVFSRGSSPCLDPHNSETRTPSVIGSLRKRAISYRSPSNTPTLKTSKGPDEKAKSLPSSLTTVANGSKTRITPLLLPPSRTECLADCEDYGLFKHDFQKPFYSNPKDITKPKEVGFNILHIPGNKLNDLEAFQSVLGDRLISLEAWRKRKLIQMGGPVMLNRFKTSQQIRQFFASSKKVVIVTEKAPPSRKDAKLWLKARELLLNKNKEENLPQENIQKLIEEDSPIKVKRQKVTMVMNEGDGGGGGGGEESGDDTDCTLTLTPMTPTTPILEKQKIENGNEKTKEIFTPLTSKAVKDSPASVLTARQKKRLARRSKVSLNAQLAAAGAEIDREASAEKGDKSPLVFQSSQGSLKSSQSSDSSVSSQVALAQMDRSSFLKNLQGNDSGKHDFSFGLTNATLDNTFGFKVKLENLQHAKADIEYNYITILTLEVFVATRGELLPDPHFDEVRCIFYAIENSIPTEESEQKLPRKACGYIIVNDAKDLLPYDGRIHGIAADIEVQVVGSELDALQALVELVHKWDPDIFAGYEIEMASWGYIIDRARCLCFNISPLLSRIPTQKVLETLDEDRDQFTDLDIEMKLSGRILLDVWRLMRSEIALTSYSFENVMYHIRHSRCPAHSFKDLTTWFLSPCSRWIVLEYYIERVRGTLAILDQLDLIGRTSEMAKLIGIQFYEILSRGSQFRVESMMLRIAKPKNLVPLSPSVQQRAHMRAPEYIPLIMEPESRFYTDPVIVLDFQSLYPSVIIAYNYCFSTCIGRIENLGSSAPFEFGASQLRVSPQLALKLAKEDLLNYSSGGIAFVKASVREGILPRMLTEILDTRQMVKQSMKLHKNNSALQRILHSRQLGLKLMANVTYGYTAANFSGRMPAVEVGDSVVARGRDTLEESMNFVERNEKWKVRVVYGDTDSMFLLVPGRSREEALKIGEEIAEAVTKRNPHPIKLKLEKVYQPCILQTKKRYVGYMYESADQKEPIFEAKGIETVRRDGCPAVGKMLEKVLRILFETKDVSLVKQYVNRQFTKLLQGKANLQDLIFAKEFRGLNGYRPTACVPALELTRKWIQTDPRRIPRSGERVPFIITNGPPGVPLIRLVRHPLDVLKDEGLKINAIYYITKAIIPPLNRCLLLIGADVNEWFANLPRKLLATPALSNANEVISSVPGQQQKKSTISQYFSSSNCLLDCGRQTMQSICPQCLEDKQKVYTLLKSKISRIERGYFTTMHLCQACCGRVGDLACVSLDCPVLFVLEMKRRDLQQCCHIQNVLQEKLENSETLEKSEP